MSEHRAPEFLIQAMALFIGVMAVAALAFWSFSAILPGGPRAVIAAAGPIAIAIFGTLHIPAAIVGILLLQWRRPMLRRPWRVALEASTLYFGLVVLVGIFFNYLAMTAYDGLF